LAWSRGHGAWGMDQGARGNTASSGQQTAGS